jgi:hypothetical protein
MRLPVYYLCITSELPMWPALQAMSGRRYRGHRAAFRALRQAIAEAILGAGLQNTPIAHGLMLWADEMERSDALSRQGWVATSDGTPFSFMLAPRQ